MSGDPNDTKAAALDAIPEAGPGPGPEKSVGRLAPATFVETPFPAVPL